MTTKIDIKNINFGIIRHRGTPNKATLPDGTVVYGKEHIFVPEYGLIKCAPYSDNFIYEMPSKFINAPSYACSCGSPAVITGLSGYVLDASPQGKLFVCLQHATHGAHFNTPSRWI